MEIDVLHKQRWEEIQQMRKQGQSISGIAQLLELDRKTVRSALRKHQWAAYQRKPKGETLLSPHQDWLVQRAPEVGYSARILYQELAHSRGYTGGYETVKLAVRPLRKEAKLHSVTHCRFETAPAEQAQLDWGQANVHFLEGGKKKVHIFVMTLGYSRRAYAEGYAHERMSVLLEAHEHAFEWFGGHCEQLLYDRMRTVSSPTGEGQARLNTTFEAFARHWGFEPRLCRPYRAKTKGKVESGGKYVKGNFLPGRTFRDMQDFNEQLHQWLLEVSDLRIHGTTHQRPIDRFAKEAAHLVSICGQARFLDAMIRDRVVAEDWLVSINTNRYSVPCRLIGKTVQVVRQSAVWQIRHKGELVAEHPVLPDRYQLCVDPAHGPGAIARNARVHYSSATTLRTPCPCPHGLEVEVRDLALYEQIMEAV